jgi:hypothetical protein
MPMTTPDEVQTRAPFVAEYSGIGRFVFADGHVSEDRSFWTGQAHNGDILICFDEDMYALIDLDSRLTSFSGLTESGLHLETRGQLHPIQQSMRLMEQTFRLVALASETRLTTPEPRGITSVRYGLTNFLFCGTEMRQLDPQSWQRVLPLTLDYLGKTVVGHICMLPSYSSASRTLRAVGGIQATAELVIDLSLSETISSDCERIADVLCRVLSVARGTKIAWIYEVSLDTMDNPVTRVYSNNVTRNYHHLPLLSDNPEDAEPTRRFAETTFPTYLAKSSQYMLDKGFLDTYLEAKLGEEYLEMPALKLTVAMEMLAARHCSGSVESQYDRIIDPVVFDDIVKELRKSIHDIVLHATDDNEKARRISERGRVRGLNQRSLSERIYRMWTDIGLRTSRTDVDLFEHSRNCLAHTGSFACSPENRAAWHGLDIPWSTPVEEYGFLVSLLDRTILRILNYNGPYIDWRRPNHYERRMHMDE